MSDITNTAEKAGFQKRMPIIAVAVVAILGAFFLRDYLSFQALQENREALINFRDANYLAAVCIFVGAYVAIVAFSLPGAGGAYRLWR